MKALLIALLLMLPLAAQEQKKPESEQPSRPPAPRVQKLFILKYADPVKVQSLMGVLGAAATANSELHAVAVSATAETMQAVEDAIRRLDVPAAAPQNIELTGYFLVGGDSEAAGTQVPKELEIVLAQLKNAFPFKTYRLLDTLTLRTRSGFGAQSSSSPEFVLSHPIVINFHVGSASVNAEGAARIDQLKAGIRMPVPAGIGQGQFTYQDLGLNADIDIKEGQKVVVGRLSMGKDQALFLVLTARVVN